jgi:DNA-binding response OmpR family regulator
MPVSILIADDDQNIALALRFLMEKDGYQVRVVADGDAALVAVERHRPDIVILDLMMPRRNGIEVCAAVRANPAIAAIPIIMLTARGMDRERRRGLRAGADEYITKPFSTREVLERVRLLLARPPAQPAGTAG